MSSNYKKNYFRMFFLFSFLFLRIKEPIGEVNHIPFLEKNDLNPFLRQHKKCVIFFTDQTLKFDFANYAIYKYSDKISFASSSIENGEKYGIKGPLYVLPFENGEVVKTLEAPQRPVAFTNWVNSLYSKDSITILHPEELRIIFSSTITCCLGVDKQERPAKLKESITFYSVPHQFFQTFDMNVSSGYYIYRSSDRQLVKFSTDPNKYLYNKVTDLHSAHLKKKPFFGGYFLHSSNLTECQTESELLSPLANKYDDKMYLGLISGSLGLTLSKQHRLDYLPVPFFILFDEHGRWIMQNQDGNDDIHNFTKVCNFIDQVINGQLNYTVLSEEGERISENIKPLTYENAIETINNDKTDAVLYITAACGGRCKVFDYLMKKEAEMMKDSTLTFYSINASINDLPIDLPTGAEVPTMFLWPSKKRALGPLAYDSYGNIDEINRFLVLESSGTFEKPDYNSSQIMREAKEYAYPFLKTIKKLESENVARIDIKNDSNNNEKIEPITNEL